MDIKKSWKKILIALLVSGLLFLVLVQTILSGVLNAKLANELTKQTGCKTTIGKCRVSLLPSIKVHIRDLTMKNPQGDWKHKNFLTLGECKAKIALLPLLRGKIAINSFRLTESIINYEVNKAGLSNIEQIVNNNNNIEKQKEKKESKLQLSLSDFWIEGVNLSYENRKTKERYECKDLRQLLSLTYNAKTGALKTRGRLSLSELYVKSAGQPILLEGVTLSLAHELEANTKKKTITIKRISSAINDIALTAKGTIKDTSLDLRIKTETVSLADILRQIPQNLSPELPKLSASGTFKLDVTAKGTTKSPRLNGTLDISEGVLKHSKLPDSIHSITANATVTENSLKISQLGLRLGKDPIDISGTIKEFANPQLDVLIKANIAMSSIKRSLKLPQGYAVDGRIISDIKALGQYNPAKPEALAVSGSLEFRQFSLLTPETIKPIKINGSVAISPEVISKDLHLFWGGSDAVCRGTTRYWQQFINMKNIGKGPRPAIQLTILSKSLRLDSLLAQPPKKRTKSSQSKQPSSAKGAVKRVLPSPLPAINLSINLSTDTLRHDGITVHNLKGNTTLNNDIVKLSLDCDLFGGHVYSRQLLNAQQDTLQLSSILDITNIDANRVISHYNDRLVQTKRLFLLIRGFDDYFYGQMSLRTNLKTHGVTNENLQTNIEGKLTGSITQGHIVGGSLTKALDTRLRRFYTIDNVHFKTLETSLRFKDEKVFFDTLKIDAKRLGEWKAYGSVGFDASLDIELENRLPLKVSQRITGLTDNIKSSASSKIKEKIKGPLGNLASSVVDKQGIPSDDEGRVTITLSLNGPATKPSVSKIGFKKVEKRTTSTTQIASGNEKRFSWEFRKARDRRKQRSRRKTGEKKKKLTKKEKRARRKRERKIPQKVKQLLK